jgi:hypothetical protein
MFVGELPEGTERLIRQPFYSLMKNDVGSLRLDIFPRQLLVQTVKKCLCFLKVSAKLSNSRHCEY